MKTLTDATLFVVNGPRGAYYAIQENESGAVLTERTEQAAAAIAKDKDMVIVDRREISHTELLEMLARRCEDRPAPAFHADQPPPEPAAKPREETSPSFKLGDFARRLFSHPREEIGPRMGK